MHPLRAIAVIASVVTALPGCAPNRSEGPDLVQEPSEIRESISEAISRNGFDYNLLSQREGPDHVDVIIIKLSLDSLKGRHLSLEKLMTEIGRVSSQPSYGNLPIRILIGAGDEDDQMYLYAILATAVKGRSNIDLMTAADSRNEVIITVRHPGQGGS